MTEADKTFEKLGFSVKETAYRDSVIRYKTNDAYANREIEFWINDKIIYNNLIYDDFTMKGSCPIDLELLEAINKKAEELGWLRELD